MRYDDAACALPARIANATRRKTVSRSCRIAAAHRNKAERYTCTLLNNATAVLSIHVAIRTWTLDVASLARLRPSRRDVLVDSSTPVDCHLVSIPARSTTAIRVERGFHRVALLFSRSRFFASGPAKDTIALTRASP